MGDRSAPSPARLQAFVAARVSLRYDDSAAGIDEQQELEAVYGLLASTLDLESETQVDYDDRDFRADPPPNAVYVLPGALDEARFFQQAAKEIQRHLVDRRPLELERNRALKLVGRPGESSEEFAARCDAAAQERADAETAKIRDRLEAKRDRLEQALAQAERRVEELDTDTRSRQATEVVAGVGAVLGALLGGRRNTRSMASAIGGAASRRGVTSRTQERKRTAEERADRTRDDLAELEQEILDEVAEIDERWRAVADDVETLSIRLEATDVRVLETNSCGCRSTDAPRHAGRPRRAHGRLPRRRRTVGRPARCADCDGRMGERRRHAHPHRRAEGSPRADRRASSRPTATDVRRCARSSTWRRRDARSPCSATSGSTIATGTAGCCGTCSSAT